MGRFELSDLKEGAHIHFIGIGGISMSGLAVILLEKGYKVSGSDRQKSHITDKLEKMGAVIYEGHAAENIEGAELIVYTAAVHMDNPEMVAAEKKKIRRIDRAECLGAIMKLYKKAVGISGTHGKTTTTAMLTHALLYAKKDPTVSIGGELDAIDGNIRAGKSDYFITEACEYTNSFLKFYPYIAVITNIEEDHLDFFENIDEICDSFRKFALLTENSGFVVANGDDENVRYALRGDRLNVIYYGENGNTDYWYENLTVSCGYPEFDVIRKGEKLCRIKLNVPGVHNVLNSLAVCAVCDLLGIEPEVYAKGIESFCGIHRRFEKLGEINGAAIIADYAHHPTEIAATINAAKDFEHNRIWCVFQPHTYTRTKTLWQSFLKCFEGVDKLLMTHIYAARENFDGYTKASVLAEQIKNRGIDAVYIENFDDICTVLKKEVQPGDIVFIMGAGDIIEVGYKLIGKEYK